MGRLGPLKAAELTRRAFVGKYHGARLVTLAAEGFKYGPIYTRGILSPMRYGSVVQGGTRIRV